MAQNVTEGASATFDVIASGPALTYQWRRNALAIAGAVAASYTTPPTVAADDGALYDCVVANAFGSVTSAAALLTVHTPPAVVLQPVARLVSVSQAATFNVTASGSAPLSYQWQRDGVAISGATSASYTTPAAVLADDGAAFTCLISNPFGSVLSNGALLNVEPLVTGLAYVSFTPSQAGGSYAPAHVLAVWIETATGSFVRTIGIWSGVRRPSLTRWEAMTGAADTDAVMGATRVVLSPVNNLTWDLMAAGSGSGTAVADGDYVLWIELADDEMPVAATGSVPGARRTSVPFTISGGAVLPVGPLDQAGFTSITIAATPSAVAPAVKTDTAGGIGGCGGGGLYALLLLGGLVALRRRRQK